MRRARTLLVALALALAAAVAACGDDDDAGGASSGEHIAGVEIIRIPPYEHTQATVDYDRSPPAGGDHGSEAAPCRFFEQEIPDEPAVHALEHGNVWLAYAPSLAAEDTVVLRALVDEYDDVFASPYPDLQAGEAVVATAWGAQLRLDSVDDPRLEQFVREFRNRSESPEASVGCAE